MNLQVSGLTIYPIKSLRGIEVDRVEVQPRGFRHDRRWMLVEADGQFITQRDDPSLVRFSVGLCDDGLTIQSPDGSVAVPFRSVGSLMTVQVWNDALEAQIVSPEVDAWLTREIGREAHLVEMPVDAPRKIWPQFGDSPVSFADAMPILVLSQSSLDDLNSHLPEPIPFDRFRANLILGGTEPYAEDSFASLRIGEVLLRSTKRCGRCLVTCTDQVTGVRGAEPLRTLAARRLYGGNACMGMYYVPEAVGEIAVEDEVNAT